MNSLGSLPALNPALRHFNLLISAVNSLILKVRLKFFEGGIDFFLFVNILFFVNLTELETFTSFEALLLKNKITDLTDLTVKIADQI